MQSCGTLSIYCCVSDLQPHQFTITIRNVCNEIIFTCSALNGTPVVFPIPCRGRYLIEVDTDGTLCPQYCCRWMYLCPCRNHGYRFCFCKDHDPEPVLLKFSLTDANYPGLPIEKGEINLWQPLI